MQVIFASELSYFHSVESTWCWADSDSTSQLLLQQDTKQSLPLSFLLILTSCRISRESVVTATLTRKSTYTNTYTEQDSKRTC